MSGHGSGLGSLSEKTQLATGHRDDVVLAYAGSGHGFAMTFRTL
jgi:hypothetical protein